MDLGETGVSTRADRTRCAAGVEVQHWIWLLRTFSDRCCVTHLNARLLYLVCLLRTSGLHVKLTQQETIRVSMCNITTWLQTAVICECMLCGMPLPCCYQLAQLEAVCTDGRAHFITLP